MKKLLINALFVMTIVVLINPVLFASRPGLFTNWQCNASDESGLNWSVTAKFQRQAINRAWAACKKASENPSSCKVAKEWCVLNYPGAVSLKAWRCTAFDTGGSHWRGDYHRTRQDAIDGAKFICQRNSALPKTCNVRLITCTHKQMQT